MAENIVGGLFGVDPQQLMQQRQTVDASNAFKFAQLDPMQRAQMAIYQGGAGLGRAASGLLGGDPEMQKVSAIKQLSSQFDLTSATGMREFARSLQSQFPQEAMMAAKRADEMDAATGKANLTEAQAIRALREPSKNAFSSLVASGKYTPESLAAYQKSENPVDLVLTDKGMTGGNKEKVAAAIEANTLIDSGTAEIANYREMIKNKEVQYGPITNLGARASAAMGSPTDNAVKQQEIESFLTGQINEVLNAAKGVQAKDDALRAERQIKGYLAQNSSAGMDKALELLAKTKLNVKKGNEAYISSLTGEPTSKQPKAPTGGNTAIYNTVRAKPGWEDATDAEIDAAVKAGKIKTGTIKR
jgi:hypothetical protein